MLSGGGVVERGVGAAGEDATRAVDKLSSPSEASYISSLVEGPPWTLAGSSSSDSSSLSSEDSSEAKLLFSDWSSQSNSMQSKSWESERG